jgi:hypothetical protein
MGPSRIDSGPGDSPLRGEHYAFVNVVSLAVSLSRAASIARGQIMSSVARTVVQGSDSPLAKGRQPRKFTPENIARIKDWVARGVGRDEIANRLEVTVNSLQVTCSRLGISLRKKSLANGNGSIQPPGVVQRSIEQMRQNDCSARPKFTLLIQKQCSQVASDLPLSPILIEHLGLEASVRGQTIVGLIGKIVRQVVEKDLAGEILGTGTRSPKVDFCNIALRNYTKHPFI